MLVPVAVALALASTASAGPVQACGTPYAPPPCSSYTIINARGTSEPQGQSVGFQTMNKNVLAERASGKIYNVVYPATWDQNSAPGTEDLINQVNKILAQDPSECLIFEGYSQGATVVVDALRKLTDAAFHAVRGVFLIGNPRHEPGLACNVDAQGGNKTVDSKGLLYKFGEGIPDRWIRKSLDDDSVCDEYDADGFIISPEHLTYPTDEGVQNMGAKFVLKQLS